MRSKSTNPIVGGNNALPPSFFSQRAGRFSHQFIRRTTCLLTLAFFSLLLLASRCLAQTTVPSAPPPPAVEGAYEHDSLRRIDAQITGSTHGQMAAPEPSPYATTLDVRRVAVALGIVLALVFVCRWGARWMFPGAAVGRSSQVMKVLSRSVIAPKQQLLLVQVGRRLVVVGDCGQQMNPLMEINDPDEVASLLGQLRAQPEASETSKPFAPLLGRARDDFGDLPIPSVTGPLTGPLAPDIDEEENELAVAGVVETRGELTGLTEKIRMLSRQLGKM